MNQAQTFAQFSLVPSPLDQSYVVGYSYVNGANIEIRIPFPVISGISGSVARAEAAEASAASRAAAAQNFAVQSSVAAQESSESAEASDASRLASEAAAEIAQTSAANAQSSSRTLALWTDLAALTPTVAGEGAEVLDSDTGTHTDPSTSATVANAGRYKAYDTTEGAWTWIGNTGLAGKLAVSTFEAQVGETAPALPSRVPIFSVSGKVPLWLEDGLFAAKGMTLETRKGVYSDVAGLFDVSNAWDASLIPLLRLGQKIPLYLRDGALGVRAFAPEVLDYLNGALDINPQSKLEGVASDGRTLRKYRAKTALVRESAASTVIRVGVTGDSWAELGTPTLKLINLLTTHYTQSPAAFVDLNPGATQQQGVTCTSSGWTLFDSSSGSSPGRSCGPDGQALYATGTSATINIAGLPGTQITIGYWDGDGTFRYRVDGGSWVSVAGTSANAVAHLQVAGLAAGTHTLDIDLTGNTGTAEVYFALGETPATSGVSVFKMGNGSSTGLNFSTVKTHIAQWSGLFALDLLVVMLGTNDSRSANPSSSPATLAQGISDLFGAHRSANADMCGIYIMPPKHGDPVSEGETFEDYAEAAIESADAIGVEWYAAIREWDDNATEMARGMWQVDHMHLSTPGANRLMAKVHILFLEI